MFWNARWPYYKFGSCLIRLTASKHLRTYTQSKCVAGIVALLTCSLLPAEGKLSAQKLQLTELASYAVPEWFRVKGGTVATDTTVVLWPATGTTLLSISKGAQTLIQIPGIIQVIGARWNVKARVYEVIALEPCVLIILSVTGSVLARKSIEFSGAIAAASTDSVWLLLARRDSGIVDLGVIGPSGSTRLESIVAKSERQEDLHLSAGGGRALIAGARTPFEKHAVTFGTYKRILFDSDTATRGITGSRPPLWIALTLVQLDRGYIQTLTDLRSDLRILALYDETGHLRRRTVVDVPLAVMASAPERKLLLVARRTSRLEMVIYGWEWLSS